MNRHGQVRADKTREALADMTALDCPSGLAPIAIDAFNAVMSGPNQLRVMRGDVRVSAADLLRIPTAPSRSGTAAKRPLPAIHRSLAARLRLRAAV